jgi:hypothetical protein
MSQESSYPYRSGTTKRPVTVAQSGTDRIVVEKGATAYCATNQVTTVLWDYSMINRARASEDSRIRLAGTGALSWRQLERSLPIVRHR